MRGTGETGGMVDGTPVGPLDMGVMAVTDGTGAMTSDMGDMGNVGPCEGHRSGWHGPWTGPVRRQCKD